MSDYYERLAVMLLKLHPGGTAADYARRLIGDDEVPPSQFTSLEIRIQATLLALQDQGKAWRNESRWYPVSVKDEDKDP